MTTTTAEDNVEVGYGHVAPSTVLMDFTSALYLGLDHPSWSLRPWPQFTTGVPAALASPPHAELTACQLAQLQGCESGVLAPSTFHLFWDLFGMLARRSVKVCIDAEVYPIARWGVERAAAYGVPVHEFAHHDAEALCRVLKRYAQDSRRPLVVTDGFCPDCGNAAPLPAYLACLREYGGRLIVDDTQALGIFGHSPSPEVPYGHDGGGTLRLLKIGGPDVLLISSLAKAFGAPVAVLSGSRSAIKEFKANSETRMHCSPPSVAAIRAAEHALCVNRAGGDSLRQHLSRLVTRFRLNAAKAGFRFAGGLFPVQTLLPMSNADTIQLHKQLLHRGVRSVLRQAPSGRGLRISFSITARHTLESVDRAASALT